MGKLSTISPSPTVTHALISQDLVQGELIPEKTHEYGHGNVEGMPEENLMAKAVSHLNKIR